MTTGPATREYTTAQYGTTDRLAARIAFHRFGVRRQDWFPWVVERLPLRYSERVVEVGAGTGALWDAVDVGRLAPRPVLTDASPAMCRALRDRGVAGGHVLRCDATALPFASGRFDGALANHMLYHVDDPGRALRELRRVLRPGGWMAAATVGRDDFDGLASLARAAGVPRVAPTPLTGFDSVSGPPLVQDCFTDVRVRTYEVTLRVPVADPVVAYLGTFADTPLRADEVAALRAAVDEVLARDGAFRMTKRTVLLTATAG